jgi:predicted dinucleotide-binding enzyme
MAYEENGTSKSFKELKAKSKMRFVMRMKYFNPMYSVFVALVFAALVSFSVESAADEKGTLAIIGTGDMGDSLGPKLAEQGYTIVYGTRDPSRDSVKELVTLTGPNASAAMQKEAAQQADIVLLAVPWPAMETVAQNLGDLSGKIVIDISMPVEQAEDGYMVRVVETSSAEMIQAWNPGAKVVKAWATLGSFVIDNPSYVDGPVTVPLASDHKDAKEVVARMVADMGLDPVDSGPLRHAHEIEGLQIIYMVPLLQRKADAWEPYFRRANYWECLAGEDWYDPVADAGNLANIPNTQGDAKPCPAE